MQEPCPLPPVLRGRKPRWKKYLPAEKLRVIEQLKPSFYKERWMLEWVEGGCAGTFGRLMLEPGPVWLVSVADSHSYLRRVGKAATLEEAGRLLLLHLAANEVEELLLLPEAWRP